MGACMDYERKDTLNKYLEIWNMHVPNMLNKKVDLKTFIDYLFKVNIIKAKNLLKDSIYVNKE
jgi:hypothetical protein